jgi:hypothetical protein
MDGSTEAQVLGSLDLEFSMNPALRRVRGTFWNLADRLDLVKFKDFHPLGTISYSSGEKFHSSHTTTCKSERTEELSQSYIGTL